MKIKKLAQKPNRIISSFLAVVMTAAMFAVVPAMAQITTYTYDDYTAEYNVQNVWTGFQTIDVKVMNTGTEPLLNWALSYDAGGEIMGVHNGVIHSNGGTNYIVKNAVHNYEIAPNASVNFGYTLKSDNPVLPEKFENPAQRVDITESFDVRLRVNNAWNTGFNGFIVLTNTSDSPIEAWQLAFDTNFMIDNLWNGRIINDSGGRYTVASQQWSNPIQPGTIWEIGLSGSVGNGIIPEISNCVKSVVSIAIPDDEEDLDLDSDEDGLPNHYEVIIGTNPRNPDSDGDEIPDGYEVITLETDPLKPDTDNNGVLNSDEDFDNDRLTNLQEYQYGTNPNRNDTDGDELTDYDEINEYNTDPTKRDSDDDTVWDSDEFEIGLDPHNPKTFGYPDADYVYEQRITIADLSEVNTLNDMFKIEIDIKAGNNVKRHLEQGESGYSYALSDNKAILGVPIILNYEAGSIESGEIKFTLDENFIRNNAPFYPHLNSGLERYGVFIFDEALNMLIPLESKYEGNTITISVSYLGNLCIIDIEAMLYDLGFEFE